jgi:rhodanese-related sulfurtransferase
MSSISLADLAYIDRETLASSFVPSPDNKQQQQQQQQPKRSLPASTAIIDVRDSDHIGGHIRGSTWVPSSELDFKLPELLRTLQDKDTVVFHCALSQQRGPSAALRYIREKERVQGASSVVESKGEVKEEGEGVEKKKEEGEGEEGKAKRQKVLVLKGGFTEWQEKYGEDEELTEGYKKDVWEFGS